MELNNNKKVIKFRNFKNIDYDQLKMDLVSTINSFGKKLTWNKSGNKSDYEMFCMLRKRCNEIAASKKEFFYKSKLSRYDNSQKSLYHFVYTFLDQTSSITLPDSSSIENVVNDFNIFFSEKIEKNHENFPNVAGKPEIDTSSFCGTILTDFEPTTIDEITEILNKSKIKTPSNDPLPALIIEENLQELLPKLYELVNISLSCGSIDGEKIAHITPLIKNHSLDSSCLKNYRPISNLSFVSKLIERVILRRLNKHLADNMLNEPLQ